MDYRKNKEVLRGFYTQNNIINHFEKDNEYLEQAFKEITNIWFDNLDQIKEVRYLMIAEAPLWGEAKKYIYNIESHFAQFFYKSDLEYVLNTKIQDKVDFIKQCNKAGILIIDISPFALNPDDTTINYRTIRKSQYFELVKNTIPAFFEEKIKAIKPKKANDIKVFFRYTRVKKGFQDLISPVLIMHDFVGSENEIFEISKRGGGINQVKFSQIINPVS